MLARNWLLHNLRVSIIIIGRPINLEVSIDAQPVHFTTIEHLLATHNRHIVFGLACNDTTVTANALIEVNGHAPLRELLIRFPDLCHRFSPRRTILANMRNMRPFRLGKLWNFLIQSSSTLTH